MIRGLILKQIKYDELPEFTEICAAGTAASLVPIQSITMHSKNDEFKYQGGGDEPGPATIKLLKQLQGIQRGLLKDPFGWVETVRQYQASEFEADGQESTNGTNNTTPNQLP